MTRVQPRKPGGFGELLPGEQIEFDRLLGIIRTTYEKYGFSPLDTPDLELTEVLLAKGGGETEQQVYSFKREGSSTDLTLRYDLTIPLARYVAEHESELVFPFRRYHIGKVHRAERQQKGRYREFYQCDIDAIGSKSTVIDAEFPAVISDIFEQFDFGEFTVHINNRILFDGLFEHLGIDATAAISTLHAIDKINKVSHEVFIGELDKAGLSPEQIDSVVTFISISGSNDEILASLEHLDITNDQFRDGISKLKAVIEALRNMKLIESRFQIDLEITRGLDYYTGTVYETFLTEYPAVGSVCSGGRYDNLASNYTKTELPGVGISIGLSRLFSQLREIPGLIKTDRQSPADVVVMPIDEAQIPYALSVAASLREAGIPTMFYSEPDAMKKKLRYADRMGFGYVLVIGESEVASRTVNFKDMAAHTSSDESIEQVVKVVLGQ